jgi:hypothetical protein
MSSAQRKPDTTHVLAGLKDFQRATVEYVYRRLYEDEDRIDRFLIADEVGLGKTLVARGVIAKAVDKMWQQKDLRIDIVYICANRDIARQNINRLNITGEREMAVATRMTLLPLYLHNLQGNRLNFVSFTPGTSFDLRSQGGIIEERVLIYHLLRQAWRLGDAAGPKNFFQVGVRNRNAWRNHLKNIDMEDVDKQLRQKYVQALRTNRDLRQRFDKLAPHFAHHRKRGNIAWEHQRDQLALIGDLRRLLAKSCVDALEPDIVILDEFQRFKHLLDGEDEMALLAQALFDYPDAKTLLISATPYKMYTMYHESADDDHYVDFHRTVRFLFGSDDKTDVFKSDLRRYREALFRVDRDGKDELQRVKATIESKLRRVMVRTERLSITANRDAMIESQTNLGRLEPQDLRAFVTLDQVAEILEVRDTVEYWKSAPYLLNLMDRSGYDIKKKLVSAVKKSDLAEVQKLLPALKAGQETFLSWEAIRAYQTLDPGNAKLRALMSQIVDRGAWQLLWIPSSLPYYAPTTGPYADPNLKDFTKTLVFSSWQVVPKVIAMLCSYEAERQMVTTFESEADYSEERQKRRPLLRFSLAKSVTGANRLTGMSNFTLLYPCLTLATHLDPLEICVTLSDGNELPKAEQVTRIVAEKIEELLAPVISKYAGSGGRSDERWYWAALALLDKHHNRRPVAQWFETETEQLGWRSMVQSRTGDDPDTHFADHINRFHERFRSRKKLGRPPADLVDVMTKIALGSPAVAALRALLRFSPKTKRKRPTTEALAAAANIALGFRTMFNIPDSITLIRKLYAGTDDLRYWESVLNYCVDGNLQATLDEYMHILLEALGLVDKPADLVVSSLGDEVQLATSIRTVNLNFDEIQMRPELELEPHTLRCHFALRFGNDKNEEGSETRADQVRKAFNSPFHPFILATTSIGQEGLDFHQYCHQIYHWNLPSNPVDLEQREGRIHRYKGHVIRRNIALSFPLSALADEVDKIDDPWEVLFCLAKAARDDNHNDLVPFWIFEPNDDNDGYKIQRHIPALPLSRDNERLEGLRRTLVAYRMVFGQPRQEDLVNYLQARMEGDIDPEELLQYRIDLSPASWWRG